MQQDNTGREIATQVDAWNEAHDAVQAASDTLQALWRDGNYDSVIFTGCGSTHYLSIIAASLFQQATHVMTRAVPASEIILNPATVYAGKHPLLVAISRSATTSETVQAVEQFKSDQHSEVVLISCYDDKPLNAMATINLTARAGQEISIAQTRSFSSMLVMAEAMAALLGGSSLSNRFPETAHEQVEEAHTLASSYADPARFERVFYLGSGARYGLACEAMLKMKEMSLTSAEAFHTLEFRHGPKSMVDDKTLIVGLFDKFSVDFEMPVIDEMQALGATTVTLSTAAAAQTDITLTHDGTRPSLVYYLPFLQWLAYLRATNKGLNPDTPRNLDQVVIL
jgi:glutamine---fructose-6-phosphate transaminase (isomerizing)